MAGTKKEAPRAVAIDLDAVEHAIVQVEFRRADVGTEDAAPDVDDVGQPAPATEGDN